MAEYTVKTLEELAALAIKRPEDRWSINKSIDHNVWDDPAAGNLWYAAEEDLRKEVMGRGDDWYDSPERNAHFEKRPTTHVEHSFSLYRSAGSWRSTRISLSNEIGEQIEKVWTKRPAYRGASYEHTVGTLTLPGIAKRLGVTDIAARVKSAQKAAADQAAINQRNYRRRVVLEAVEHLMKRIEEARAEGVSVEYDEHLAALKGLMETSMEVKEVA